MLQFLAHFVLDPRDKRVSWALEDDPALETVSRGTEEFWRLCGKDLNGWEQAAAVDGSAKTIIDGD